MFGYIHPLKPEMKIRDYETFRAYYCGVCRSISKRTGQSARMALTYDATFYAIFLDALHKNTKTGISMNRCIRHPLKKRAAVHSSDSTDYASDVNVILAWFSMLDHYQDGEGVKSVAGMAALRRAFKRCKKRNPKLCDFVANKLSDLHRLEKENCPNIDMVSETFADILRYISCPPFLELSNETQEAVQWFGYNLGKWLYLIDAFDDLEQDAKKKRYNPFLARYEYNPRETDIGDFKKKIKEQAEFLLLNCLDQVTKAYRFIDVYRNKDIIENIIYLGMLNKTDQILQGEKEKNEKSV
ncbi:MAG: DUF5685 family protein [Clostridia bacterium]|jgi:hypothetical protein